MSDDRPPPSLDELNARLRKARGEQDQTGGAGGRSDDLPKGPLALAFRIGVEMIAAMIVGVGGGLLIDRWLGSAPWGLIVMFFLGAAAGVVNVYRAVNGIGYAPGYRRPDGTPRRGKHD